MNEQDWETVVIRKTRPTGTVTNKKVAETGRPNLTQNAAAVRKLENSDTVKPRQLSVESRTEITQRRVALGKTQVQLNLDCKFGVNVIRDIENGKYCPQPQQLSILNRLLRSSIKYAVL